MIQPGTFASRRRPSTRLVQLAACRACAATRRSARPSSRARRPRRRRTRARAGPRALRRAAGRRVFFGPGAGGTAISAQRRQVDLAEVVLPVDRVDVEAEALRGRPGAARSSSARVVAVVEDAVELAVRAVDLVEAAQAVELALVLVQLELDVVAARAVGQRSTSLRPLLEQPVARGRASVRISRARGEAPLAARSTGRPSSSGSGCVAEVAGGDVRQVADRERVAHARGHVEQRGPSVGRVRGGHEARVGDEVDRDDVDPDATVGGEAAGDDARRRSRAGSGRRPSATPSSPGRACCSADSTIVGRTIVRCRGLAGDQRALAERLRERVGVRPAERAGALAAALDELVADPLVAQHLGARADGGAAGGADRALRPRRRSASGAPAGATRPRCRGATSLAASSSASRSSHGSEGAVPDGRSSTSPVRWPAA